MANTSILNFTYLMLHNFFLTFRKRLLSNTKLEECTSEFKI